MRENIANYDKIRQNVQNFKRTWDKSISTLYLSWYKQGADSAAKGESVRYNTYAGYDSEYIGGRRNP